MEAHYRQSDKTGTPSPHQFKRHTGCASNTKFSSAQAGSPGAICQHVFRRSLMGSARAAHVARQHGASEPHRIEGTLNAIRQCDAR